MLSAPSPAPGPTWTDLDPGPPHQAVEMDRDGMEGKGGSEVGAAQPKVQIETDARTSPR